MTTPGTSTAQGVPADSYGLPLPGGFARLTRLLNALGTLWIVALMLLINTDVLGRELIDAPVRGVTELVSLSIVGIVFLQLADTLAAGRMTRADVLLDRLKRTTPWLAALLQALYHAVGALLMAVILWAAWEPLVESIRIQEYVGALGDFTAPVWPVRLIMLVGMVATLVTFVLLAWLDLRRSLALREARA
ncbi:TRAP transporter small permease subunit [Comamonas flocculans]|uniref:TRAP transporter small permease protein n=1 Tax=Comamonas flocculans TaxID=2597701 RepID=A0A5B8RVX7_9BURK|nr:TRAP transporter small permease [Comamonas flocculans]QEA12844.1 TRAP transporter small permease [Comamonas flocculans]